MGYINETELCEKVKNEKYSGTAMIIYTDKFCCRTFDGNTDSIENTEHLLEIRIFNEEREFKALRADIGKPFMWRVLSDSNYEGSYDEIQYLDVDEKKTSETLYAFTGGGRYEMPESGLERAVIRHYYIYDGDGIENVVDERIVRFLLRKGEEY